MECPQTRRLALRLLVLVFAAASPSSLSPLGFFPSSPHPGLDVGVRLYSNRNQLIVRSPCLFPPLQNQEPGIQRARQLLRPCWALIEERSEGASIVSPLRNVPIQRTCYLVSADNCCPSTPPRTPIHSAVHQCSQRPFLGIVARLVPACMLVGASMEFFMLKTGFCECSE